MKGLKKELVSQFCSIEGTQESSGNSLILITPGGIIFGTPVVDTDAGTMNGLITFIDNASQEYLDSNSLENN